VCIQNNASVSQYLIFATICRKVYSSYINHVIYRNIYVLHFHTINSTIITSADVYVYEEVYGEDYSNTLTNLKWISNSTLPSMDDKKSTILKHTVLVLIISLI